MNPIELVAGDTRATIIPERGAIVTKLSVGGRPLLYLDDETLRDVARNVRGGIPVLFPTPGKLVADRWQWPGPPIQDGTLPQHGFARRYAFHVVAQAQRDLLVRLDWSPGEGTMTAEEWPWACSLELGYRLEDSTLHIDQTVTNRASTAMPFGIGFHPYFAVAQADKDATRIPTQATRAYDNVTKSERSLSPHEPKVALVGDEVDLHLVDHGADHASLVRRDGSTIHLRGSPEMQRWVVWTLGGKDFVCLEPWTCSGDAINTSPAEQIVLEPGEHRALRLTLSLSR